MKRSIVLCLVIGWTLVASFAVAGEAGEEKPEFLSMSHQIFVQPGSELAFEEAIKEHWKLHEAAGDPWTWEVWTQVTGKGTGSYSIRSAGHTWADLDRDNGIEGDREHVLSAITKHTKWTKTTVTQWDFEISRWPEGDEVPKMVEITEFRLRSGSSKEFYHAIKKLHQLIGDKGLDYEYAWGWLASGGSGSTMVLAMPRDGWADFKDKKPGIWEVAEEVFGRTESGHLREAISAAVEDQRNFAVMHRPDLSYSPAGS